MHAKGKEKGSLSREEEDELVEVEQQKVEEAYVEEEEECHRGGIQLRTGQILQKGKL